VIDNKMMINQGFAETLWVADNIMHPQGRIARVVPQSSGA